MNTRWSTALVSWIGETQANRPKAYELAELAGIRPSTVSRYLSGKLERPTEQALRGITRAVAAHDPDVAVKMVCEHLHDEITRAGLVPESITIKGHGYRSANGRDEIGETCARIAIHARMRPDVSRLLESLLVLLESAAGLQSESAPLRVAESRPIYATPRKPSGNGSTK